MAAGTVADGEAGRLLADLGILALVRVHLGERILEAFLLQPLRQLLHRKPRIAADNELLQRVVYEFVLVLCP